MVLGVVVVLMTVAVVLLVIVASCSSDLKYRTEFENKQVCTFIYFVGNNEQLPVIVYYFCLFC